MVVLLYLCAMMLIVSEQNRITVTVEMKNDDDLTCEAVHSFLINIIL